TEDMREHVELGFEKLLPGLARQAKSLKSLGTVGRDRFSLPPVCLNHPKSPPPLFGRHDLVTVKRLPSGDLLGYNFLFSHELLTERFRLRRPQERKAPPFIKINVLIGRGHPRIADGDIRKLGTRIK